MTRAAEALPFAGAPGATGRDPHRSPARTLIVSAGADDRLRLFRTAQQLNYRVVDEANAGLDVLTGADAALAAIVSDSGLAPLETSRRLSVSCPVILVTDETGFADRLAAARAGVTGLVRRPVNPAEISEWLSVFEEGQSAAAISVVIVDDDRLSSEISASVLRSAGMNVIAVSDPVQALGVIEEVAPDIVLMDVNMPGVDGVELARVLRQSMRLASLPLVFLSAERDEGRQLLLRNLGGDDFIAKPVQPHRLISLVRLRANRSKFLRSLIERDRLTGLLNHARFRERLTQELERCRRSGAEICLAMIDIDHFKRVNDQHGHLVGDQVLRGLSDLFGQTLRRIDVAGRCGGEEFGVILLDNDAPSAARVVGALKQRFGETIFQGGARAFSVTFSAGVTSSEGFDDVAALIAAADRALYAAKRSGRDAVRVADAPRKARSA